MKTFSRLGRVIKGKLLEEHEQRREVRQSDDTARAREGFGPCQRNGSIVKGRNRLLRDGALQGVSD
jgi:hypothetical protein